MTLQKASIPSLPFHLDFGWPSVGAPQGSFDPYYNRKDRLFGIFNAKLTMHFGSPSLNPSRQGREEALAKFVAKRRR